jgi:hypothetical protein
LTCPKSVSIHEPPFPSTSVSFTAICLTASAAGLLVWRPYEQLDGLRQQAMLEAAATALHLAGTGAITGRGTLGPLLTRGRHQPVYDGDRPSTQDSAYRQMRAEAEAFIDGARTDPAAARHLLARFTYHCRTAVSFNHERQFLIDFGISESPHLPRAGPRQRPSNMTFEACPRTVAVHSRPVPHPWLS